MRSFILLLLAVPLIPNMSVDELPQALILGDSISIGYTPHVKTLLQGKVNVSRPQANCGSTVTGLGAIDKWLGPTDWDVIHFNWGLHDLCYRHPDSKTQGNRDKIKGTQAVSPEQYEQNLEKLVQRLQKTGARLIFATTTVVPEGEAGRFVGDDDKYNQIALRVMQKYSVEVNDLHALTSRFTADMFSGPGNVHFTTNGSRKLADQVAAAITATTRTP